MKILVINPVGTDRWNITDKEIYSAFASSNTSIYVVSLKEGPKSIENKVAEAEVLNGVIERARELHKSYDGIIVNCCLDVGIDAIHSIIDTPILGPCKASLALASVIGRKIGIVTVSKSAIKLFEELVIKYRMEKRVVTIRGIDLTVPEIEIDEELTIKLLKDEIENAIREGVDVILLGCTGLAGFAKKIQNFFEIPILDPVACSIKVMEDIIEIMGEKNE